MSETPDYLKTFRDMAYLPWNHMLSVVKETISYSPTHLEVAAADILKAASERIEEMTPAQRAVFEWHTKALNELVRQFAAAVGTDNPPPRFADYSRTSIERMCQYICKLTVPPFMGITPPQPTVRCSPVWQHHQRSMVIDIVPSDPRWGRDDIPDWNDDNPTEVRPPR